MEFISYQSVKEALEKAVPQLKDELLEEVTAKLLLHLFEYAKELIFTQEDSVLIDNIIVMLPTQKEYEEKLLAIIEHRFHEKTAEQQKVLQELLYIELVARGNDLYRSLSSLK